MMERVQLIGWTEFRPPTDISWERDLDVRDIDSLIEVAGRACYQSWNRPNARTATNSRYLDHIKEIGHMSVLEHASATFYIRGVSRSFTHELVRHRHLSFSQLSQRYVDESQALMVMPGLIEDDPDLQSEFVLATEHARVSYEKISERLAERGDLSRKEIRQVARSVMPNATETAIVVTGNMRAWRHFIKLRATAAADTEIRMVAIEILRWLQEIAPNTFGDYDIVVNRNDNEIAVSRYGEND